MKHSRLVLALLISIFLLVPLAINRAQTRSSSARDDNPAAFGPWYGDAFKREQAAAFQRGTWDARGFYVLDDFKGQYFNFTGGIRVTTGQPARDHPAIYLSGDSVMYGYTVPDDGTIASALQRVSRGYKVVNLGAPGTNATIALNRLRTLDLRAGDTVVWFGGINESRAIYYAAQKLEIKPAGDWLQKRLDTMRRDMQRDILASAHYVRSRGARFVWILQPYLWSMPLTANEAAIYVNDDLRAIDIAARPIQQALALPGVEAYDFTHIVDGLRSAGVEVYMDHIHLNLRGNEAVARAIFDYLTTF